MLTEHGRDVQTSPCQHFRNTYTHTHTTHYNINKNNICSNFNYRNIFCLTLVPKIFQTKCVSLCRRYMFISDLFSIMPTLGTTFECTLALYALEPGLWNLQHSVRPRFPCECLVGRLPSPPTILRPLSRSRSICLFCRTLHASCFMLRCHFVEFSQIHQFADSHTPKIITFKLKICDITFS